MKDLLLENYQIQEKGYERNGNLATNFIIALRGLAHDVSENKIIYKLQVIVDGNKEFDLEVDGLEINRKRWELKIPAITKIDNKKVFYQALKEELIQLTKTMQPTEYLVWKTGFQEVCGQMVFAFSNGSITDSGFDTTIHAKIPGYIFKGTCDNRNDSLRCVMKTLNGNMTMLYPVFIMNFLSVSCGVFRKIGMNLGLSLFIGGDSGTGKTSVAKAAGTFVESNDYGLRMPISSTERIRLVVERLTESAGIPVIIDDVRNERTTRQREKSISITDIALRSVYQGQVTESVSKMRPSDMEVTTCAILTGEYRDTDDGQTARLLVRNMQNFLKSQDNRRILTELQENPKWIADVVGKYIQWFLGQIKSKDYYAECKKRYSDLREQPRIYDGADNGVRLKDSQAMLEFITGELQRFVYETTPELNKQAEDFFRKAQNSIEVIVQDTYRLLHGMEMVACKAMEELIKSAISNGEVRIAKFEKGVWLMGYKWRQEQFCFLHNAGNGESDVFLFIEGVEAASMKTDSRGIPVDDISMLLVRRDELEMRLESILKSYVEKGELTEYLKDKINVPYLAQLGLICVMNRTDGVARYSLPYPQFEFYLVPDEEYGWDRTWLKKTGDVWNQETIRLNLKHPVFRDKDFLNLGKERGIDPVLNMDEYMQVAKSYQSFRRLALVLEKKDLKR